MRWVYYGVALLATCLAGLLWYVVLVIYPAAPRAAALTTSAAMLPVVPVLHTASPALLPATGEKFLCVAGYVARQKGDVVETLLVDNKPVQCR